MKGGKQTKKKITAVLVLTLLVVMAIFPVSGNENLNKTKQGKQGNIVVEKVATNSGDDVEIYIYAGHQTDDPAGLSYGFGITIEVINHLSEAIWVYFQEDYFSLLSGQPIDAFQWMYQFVVPPNESPSFHYSSGGVPIPCWYRVTAQAYVIESVSRSGFQFRRFIFFPGEK